MTKSAFIPNRGQFRTHVKGKVPLKSEVLTLMHAVVEFLFPVLAEHHSFDQDKDIDRIIDLFAKILHSYDTSLSDVPQTINGFNEALPIIYKMLIADAKAIYLGDPAANSIEEVIISYPGFYAILIYRIAHELDRLYVPVIPRMLTEYSHSKTGIDIHPSARIGQSFCIDHGTGIVIGESTVIGDSVKIYQGVTLGALSVSKEKAGSKRHPTIEDHVTIYAGSSILGGNTIVGHHSVIGGNVWLTHSIDPFSLVVNKNKIRLRDNSPDRINNIDFVI